VIAPFYVAAGFALYLARRTELEAWDLELQFRRFAGLRQRRSIGASGTSAVTLAIVAIAIGFAFPSPVCALTLSPREAREEIAAILTAEDFGRTREVSTWSYVGDGAGREEASELPTWLVDALQALGRGAELGAVVLKWLLYLSAGVLIIALLQRIIRAPPRLRRGTRGSPAGAWGLPATAPRRTMDLPTDVVPAVRTRLAAGDTRGALALLYAASIALIERRCALEIPASATETEYLAMVLARRPPQEGALMRRVVGLWQRQAYAHREPVPAELEALLADWRRWEAEAREG
jgi:hypothetical protein